MIVKAYIKKARSGVIKEFTGISDPYDVPDKADIVINTAEHSIEQEVDMIIHRLQALGYV